MEKIDLIISGVGGQGTILAGKLISTVALRENLDIKTAETHGMAQRGGSVITHVRIGKKVFSPLISEGEADFVLSFELLEGLRYLPFLSPEGTAIVNNMKLNPLPVLTGQQEYPAGALGEIKEKANKAVIIDALDNETVKKNPKTLNMLLTGALAALLPFQKKSWEEVMDDIIPEKLKKDNIKAFHDGYKIGARLA